MALRLLHSGDFHLGAQLRSLPAEVAEALRQSVRDAVAMLFEQARAGGIDLVVLTGDLFEHDGVDPAQQLRFLYEQAAAVAPVPVVITPGNHDPFCADSPYATISWPENVVLFTSGDFTRRETAAGPVAGRAVQAGEGAGAVDWTSLPAPVGDSPLLVMHASVMRAGDGRRNRNTVSPVTLDKLQRCGYSYTALGHFHRLQHWPHANSSLVCAAYPGCPQGQGWDEPGEKGYLRVDLDAAGAGVEFIKTSRHVWHRDALVLPPEHAADAEARLLAALQLIYDKLDDGSLLKLTVNGRWPADGRTALEQLLSDVNNHAWHADPADIAGVDFYPPLVKRGESEVVDRFMDSCEAATTAAGDDPEAVEVWQLVQYLGRRLFSGQGLPEEVA